METKLLVYAHRCANVQLTAIIEREGGGYVALCPQLDIASQGESVAEARENLTEALGLFFETAERSEVKRSWTAKFRAERTRHAAWLSLGRGLKGRRRPRS